jgi:S1-C subfamily serine protease
MSEQIDETANSKAQLRGTPATSHLGSPRPEASGLDPERTSLERDRLHFERQKLAIEFRLKRRELADRHNRGWKELLTNPLALAIVGGFITLMTTIVSNSFSTRANIEAESFRAELADKAARQTLQADLIKKFAETAKVETARENLRFLVEAGLLPQYEQKIAAYLKTNPTAAPQVGGSSEKNVTPADIVKEFRASIGYLVVEWLGPDGQVKKTVGTCFVVSKQGYALAAAHLFDGTPTNVSVQVALGSQRAPVRTAQLIRLDKESDLALIQLPNDIEYTPVKMSHDQVLIGDAVSILGFPSPSDLSLIFGSVYSLNETGGLIGIVAAVSTGQSGSPVFNRSGEVVAIVRGGYESTQRILAAPMLFSRTLLPLVGLQ